MIRVVIRQTCHTILTNKSSTSSYVYAGKWMRNAYFRMVAGSKIVKNSSAIFRQKQLP